jgi:ankyrin repeat protein
VVQLLLEGADVDVNSRRMTNLTPLSLAAKNGHEAVVKLLLNSGVQATTPGRRCCMLLREGTKLLCGGSSTRAPIPS